MNNEKRFPVIETDRFTLRQFTDDDLENVFSGLSNPEVTKYYGVRFDSLKATEEQMDWFKNLENENKGIWWAIGSKDDKIFYGACGFNDLDKQNRKAEVGFWLLPDHWGKGIMTEVMPLICEFGIKNLSLHRIEGFVDSENEKCKKALARLEFNYEGTMVDCEIKNERFVSIDIYARITSTVSWSGNHRQSCTAPNDLR
ncbi:MAG: GNAT family N-acetyltransferase [Prolixibacteraceae bacterium]